MTTPADARPREDDADGPPQDGVGALSLRGWHLWRCEQILTDGLVWRPILDLRTVIAGEPRGRRMDAYWRFVMR